MIGTFIVSNEREANTIRNNISQRADVRVFATSLRENSRRRRNDSKEVLKQYETKYGCRPLWKYIYMDRFLVKYSYEDIIALVCGIFSFYESIFGSSSFDFYFDETIATLQSYIAYLVAEHFGTKYVALMAARGFETTHHYLVREPYQYEYGFDPEYKNKKYDQSVTDMAIGLYNRYHSDYSRPASMDYVKSRPALSLKQFLRAMRSLLCKESFDKYDIINYHSYKQEFLLSSLYFRYLRSRKYFSQPVSGDKYVYFPLHYQPEASTLVCAPKYEKQEFFIDSWAKSLPSDTVLYVKEHYELVGNRPYSFYKRLRMYPNVRIIDPWVPSIELIRGSEAVTTLTGTAGWEAAILSKPVYLAGNIYYDNAPGVYKTNDIFGAYSSDKPGAKKEEIIQYLCEYISHIYPGGVFFTKSRYLENDNISRICDSLMCFIKENS